MAEQQKDPATILAALALLVGAIGTALQRLGFRFKVKRRPRSDRAS